MDIFLSPNEDNLKRTITCLKELTGDPELESLEPKDFREYAVIRYGTPYGFCIDLVTALGERLSWSELESNIVWKEFGLIKMKEGTSHFKERDKLDLIYLHRVRTKLLGRLRRK